MCSFHGDLGAGVLQEVRGCERGSLVELRLKSRLTTGKSKLIGLLRARGHDLCALPPWVV